jgi:hypothetical protein
MADKERELYISEQGVAELCHSPSAIAVDAADVRRLKPLQRPSLDFLHFALERLEIEVVELRDGRRLAHAADQSDLSIFEMFP